MPVAGHMSMDCMVAANKDCKIVGPSMVKVLCKAMVADMDLVDMGLAGMGLDMVQHMDLGMVVASDKYHRDVHWIDMIRDAWSLSLVLASVHLAFVVAFDDMVFAVVVANTMEIVD